MTIDEAIIQARIQLTIWEEGCESKLDNSPKAVETLIEIARKYQKIRQIYEMFQKNGDYNHHMAWFDVMGVVKDGKDDN